MEPTDHQDIVGTAADDAGENTVNDITAAGPLVEEELLVEEISIDGMCGVY